MCLKCCIEIFKQYGDNANFWVQRCNMRVQCMCPKCCIEIFKQYGDNANFWVERCNRCVQCMCPKCCIEIFFLTCLLTFCVKNCQSIKFVSHFHMFQITHKVTSPFDVERKSKAAPVNYVGLYVRDANFALSHHKYLWEVQNVSKKRFINFQYLEKCN